MLKTQKGGRYMKDNLEPGIYILYGEEKFLLHKFMNNLKSSIAFSEVNISIFEDALDVEAIITACEQIPFSSGKKLVIVKGFPTSNSYLNQYINNMPSGLLLVFVSDKIDKKLKFVKGVDKVNGLIEFKKLSYAELRKYIQKELELEGATTMDEPALNELIERSGYYNETTTLYDINNYIKILSNFKTITKEIVQRMVKESPENNVFRLTEVLKSNPREAIKFTRGLLQEHNPVAIISLLIRHFRILFKIKIGSEAEIDISYYALKKIGEHKNLYSITEIIDILHICTSHLRMIRSGKMKGDNALEAIVVDLIRRKVYVS